MARLPSPTAAERRTQALAVAKAAALEADATKVAESRKLADRLLTSGVDARFDALSDATIELTRKDRRRLLSSMIGKEPPRRIIPAGTATRWALIRSRLPYRTSALATFGLMILLVSAAALVARSNTPLGMVLSNHDQPVQLPFTLKDGQVAFDTLEPRLRYALMSQDNNVAVLRRWVPGVGYAQGQLSVDEVHWAP